MKKYKFLSLFLSVILMFGAVVPAVFAEDDNVSTAQPYLFRTEAVDEEENKVKVWLELDPAIAESVASYQIAIQLINMSADAFQGREVTLEFDEAIKNAKVKATKYDNETQTLRVYVADKENLVQIVKNSDTDTTNILPIGVITVEKTADKAQNAFKLVLLGATGELAVADAGCNVKKAVDVYGDDFIIPNDGTVYGESTNEPGVDPEEPTTTKPEEPTTGKTEEPTTDKPGTSEPDKTDCSCICHKTGFMRILYKIFRIFWRILGKNPVCACGKAHY